MKSKCYKDEIEVPALRSKYSRDKTDVYGIVQKFYMIFWHFLKKRKKERETHILLIFNMRYI